MTTLSSTAIHVVVEIAVNAMGPNFTSRSKERTRHRDQK